MYDHHSSRLIVKDVSRLAAALENSLNPIQYAIVIDFEAVAAIASGCRRLYSNNDCCVVNKVRKHTAIVLINMDLHRCFSDNFGSLQ